MCLDRLMRAARWRPRKFDHPEFAINVMNIEHRFLPLVGLLRPDQPDALGAPNLSKSGELLGLEPR